MRQYQAGMVPLATGLLQAEIETSRFIVIRTRPRHSTAITKVTSASASFAIQFRAKRGALWN